MLGPTYGTGSLLVASISTFVPTCDLRTSALPHRVQSTYMVQSMVSVVVISLMVWVSIPHMGT